MTRKAPAPVRTDLQEATRTSHMQLTKVIAMNSPNSRSIPELFSDAVGQLAKLVGNEFDLARAELSEKASQVGKAAAMIGAGAVVLMPALVLLLFAVSAGVIRGGVFGPVASLLTGAGRGAGLA